MKNTFVHTLKIGVLALAASLLLSSCAMLEGRLESEASKINPQSPYQDIAQKDHWLDNAKAWRYWDVGDPNNGQVEWSFVEGGLSIQVDSTADLNQYDHSPHTLSVKIIQLSDVSGLKTLIQNPAGVGVVMSEALEMIPNGIYVDQLLVAPNQSSTFDFSRQQDAKFIAIISGYVALDPQASVRIIPIPVITIKAPKQESSWLDKLTLGLFAEEQEPQADQIRPATLKLNVTFGAASLEKFAAKAY
jgi:hypothetical protein